MVTEQSELSWQAFRETVSSANAAWAECFYILERKSWRRMVVEQRSGQRIMNISWPSFEERAVLLRTRD